MAIARIRLALFRIRFSHAHRIFTHLTAPEKYLLYKLAKSLPKNTVCVEIGAYLGASSCIIASGLNDSSRLFSIDTWQNDAMISTEAEAKDPMLLPQDTFQQFLDNVRYIGNKVTPLRGWSTDMVHHLKGYQQIGFLFIDGDHSYESVKADWHAYAPLLGINSIVAFHDTGWAEGVNQIIEEEVLKIARQIYKLPNLEVYRISAELLDKLL